MNMKQDFSTPEKRKYFGIILIHPNYCLSLKRLVHGLGVTNIYICK